MLKNFRFFLPHRLFKKNFLNNNLIKGAKEKINEVEEPEGLSGTQMKSRELKTANKISSLDTYVVFNCISKLKSKEESWVSF
jgi:hypothetical protein